MVKINNNGIVTSNKLNIIQDLIPITNKTAHSFLELKPEYITVHNTANPGVSAYNHTEYVDNVNEYVSWHFSVDDKKIYQELSVYECAWHGTDGLTGTGNRKSIAIEVAEIDGAEEMAITLIAELLKALDLKVDKVVPHNKWNPKKNCPRLILPHWDSFINNIKRQLLINILLEEMTAETDNTVSYSVTTNKTYQLTGDVKDFGVKVVNRNNKKIEEKNCTNGTFFWYKDKEKTNTYPTSILYVDGIIHWATANHHPSQQSVFIVYKDNSVEMKRILNIHELELDNIRLVIGGVGLKNVLDKDFKYNPAYEGFTGLYSDVLQKRNKTVLGYNKSENKIYLMVRPSIFHDNVNEYDLLELIDDCCYDIAISLDGGGSTFMNNDLENVFKGSGRLINNIVGFNLG